MESFLNRLRSAHIVEFGIHDDGLEIVVDAKRVNRTVSTFLLVQVESFDVLGNAFTQAILRIIVHSVLEGIIEQALGSPLAETTPLQACDDRKQSEISRSPFLGK